MVASGRWALVRVFELSVTASDHLTVNGDPRAGERRGRPKHVRGMNVVCSGGGWRRWRQWREWRVSRRMGLLVGEAPPRNLARVMRQTQVTEYHHRYSSFPHSQYTHSLLPFSHIIAPFVPILTMQRMDCKQQEACNFTHIPFTACFSLFHTQS